METHLAILTNRNGIEWYSIPTKAFLNYSQSEQIEERAVGMVFINETTVLTGSGEQYLMLATLGSLSDPLIVRFPSVEPRE